MTILDTMIELATRNVKGGIFVLEHYRQGQLLDRSYLRNTVMTVGKNKILDIMFGTAPKITPWYMGLVDNAGFSAFNVADTMASHSGWTEFTSYNEATRPVWTPGTASGGAINGSGITFTINASGTLKGLLLVTDNTKGGTTGTLWCSSPFASNRAVVNTDVLSLAYGYTA